MDMSDYLCNALFIREGKYNKELADQYRVVYDPANSSGSSYTSLTHVYKNGVLVEIRTNP
jgi:hypothetical protein